MRPLARVALNVALLPVSIPLAAGVVVGRAWEVLWPEARGLVSAKAELRRIRKAKAAGVSYRRDRVLYLTPAEQQQLEDALEPSLDEQLDAELADMIAEISPSYGEG